MGFSFAAKKILIVGSGLSGAVVANEIARAGHSVDVIEKRSHIAGNIYTERDKRTGIIKHVYGPHIFNTNNEEVWKYVNNLTPFSNFINRVKVNYQSQIYSFPINLHTINQFFSESLNPHEAEKYIEKVRDKKIINPKNFEEQAHSMVGKDLYEAFLKGYTIKQWGCDPREIPATVLKRLPLRFNYNDNYYDKRFQGIPNNGYTEIISKLLDHEKIHLILNQEFIETMNFEYSHIFFSGKIDEFFGYQYGMLGYRTVYWEDEVFRGDFQGNAVINYTDMSVDFTRVIEHRHFYPNLEFTESLISREFSKETLLIDEPFYPKRLSSDLEKLNKYSALAKSLPNIFFIGRLGTYRYLDMDKIIEEALELSHKFLVENN